MLLLRAICFNALGKLGALVKNMRAYQETQQPALIDTITGAVAQFEAESDVQALIGTSYISQLNNPGAIGALAAGVASAIVNRKVFRDNPRAGQTLQQNSLVLSLQEVIRQMRAAGATVLAMTITALPSAFTGTGNGAVVASVRRPFDGLVLENSFAENMLLTCAADSYTGGALEGNEGFALTGPGRETNPFAFDWPSGSGAQTSLAAIDGNSDFGSGNLLVNSGFENWTGAALDDFSITVGAYGTQIVEETSIIYDGESAVRLVGDGSTLTAFDQEFDADDGTPAQLAPLTQYSCNLFLRRDGSAAAAGTLAVELVDGDGTVILDENGASNTFTIALTMLTTSYTAYNGVFRTPTILPDEAHLRLRQTVALSAGRSVYLDKLSLGIMTQAYVSGPFVALHAGSIPFVTEDFATVAVTNSRGAAGTLSTFQTLLARLFPLMIASEFLLPSAAVPTISDSLIA